MISRFVCVKLIELIQTVGGAPGVRTLDLDSARWAVMVIRCIDRWLTDWAQKASTANKVSANQWQVRESELLNHFQRVHEDVRKAFEEFARLHGCHGADTINNVKKLKNMGILGVCQANEIKECFDLASRFQAIKVIPAGDRDCVQWHLLVDSGIAEWLNKAIERKSAKQRS